MSVKPLPRTLSVTPKQGTQSNARRDTQRDGQTRSRDKGEGEDEQTAIQPSVNAFGEVIGKVVNISA